MGAQGESFMRMLKLAGSLLLVMAGIAVARADSYPSKPITMIVPFPAGGPTDTIARLMSEHMRQTLGQSILVETVTGAGATIGVGRVVSAAPDGYTVGIGNWSSHVGSPAIYPVSWNPLNDLTPIVRLPVSSLMIVGKESLPANNAKELIAWLKANPDKASAASVGAGSGAHVCGLYFGQKTETKFQFVFYRGGAPAMQDMLAGTIDIMCAEASQTLAHVTARKIKAFAVMGRKRYAGLPDVPTMEEMGITGMDISFWHGMWAPKGAPKDVVDKLNDAAVKALADPAVQKRVAALGMTIPDKNELTPQALHDYHKAELDKWWPIIKSYGIKLQ
jgi:tripartite-type tricarboxylate transporter receptor subunit TctC